MYTHTHIYVCVLTLFSHVQLFAALWAIVHQSPLSICTYIYIFFLFIFFSLIVIRLLKNIGYSPF